jgi:hypothetical protein
MKKRFRNITPFPTPIFLIGIFSLLACSYADTTQNNNQAEEKKAEAKPAIIKKPASSFEDTMIIDSKSAVFYNPDSLQMKKIKAVNEKPVFAMLEHDCFYQMQNARVVLKKYWPQVKVIEISKSRYMLFVKADKSKVCIDLNNKNDICGIFLFNRKKDPELVDMPNINTALGFYFEK